MVAVMPRERARMRYQTVECTELAVDVRIAHFHGQSGVDEYHLMLCPTVGADIATQAAWVMQAYQDACAALGLAADTSIFKRFFCSDLANQAAILDAQLAGWADACAVSWVTQPPTPPAKIALWAYHVHVPGEKLAKRKTGATLALRRGDLEHRWTAGLICPDAENSLAQTERILTRYEDELRARGLHIAEHVIRTWFFVQNVDANYQGLVTARKDFFTARGLTADTHYIASTGIEGRAGDLRATVMMDAYAVAGVRAEQIYYLEALENLCPTHVYGVTFERGVAVDYRDRRHVLISGTASIDSAGEIVHPGNVLKQLDRTLENVRALLHQAGADVQDVCAYIVYVRDISDLDLIQRVMAERVGRTPMQVVVAPVCRPGWLIEIECQAIVPINEPGLPAF